MPSYFQIGPVVSDRKFLKAHLLAVMFFNGSQQMKIPDSDPGTITQNYMYFHIGPVIDTFFFYISPYTLSKSDLISGASRPSNTWT